MSQKTHDIIIVGAGPSGLSAAFYSAWLGMKTVVLETSMIGGRAFLAPKLENYPGFPEGIKGTELVERMIQQAKRFNAEFKSEEVVGLKLQDNLKQVTTRSQTYVSPAVIIATGTQRRKLRVSGETELLGRGVSYCATCDGPFFRKRTVAIVGNGEEAGTEALALADLAAKVIVVTQEQALSIEGALMERLKSKPNVEIVKGKLTQIIGDQVVKAIRIQDYTNQKEIEIAVNGVFVALGGVPLTAIVQNAGITTERNGCLIVDRHQRTNVAGVFASGDCTCGGMQVVTAAGEGATAAMRASAFIRKGSA